MLQLYVTNRSVTDRSVVPRVRSSQTLAARSNFSVTTFKRTRFTHEIKSVKPTVDVILRGSAEDMESLWDLDGTTRGLGLLTAMLY